MAKKHKQGKQVLGGGAHRELRALLLTLAAGLTVELFSRTPLYTPDRYSLAAVFLLAIVVYAAVRWGLRAGLTSAAVAVLYNTYFLWIPGEPLHFTGRGLRRAISLGLVLPGLALVVGRLREHVDRLLERERRLRTDAEAARDEARQAATRFAFFAEASAVLASSLDYAETLGRLAHLTVPRIADWCAISVVEDGEVRLVDVVHADPAKQGLIRELQERYPPSPDAPIGAFSVLRTGRPALLSDVAEATLESIARDAEHMRIVRELGLRSCMIVPLIARGHTLGVIAFMSGESGRRYTEDDLALAEEVARRAALAVDNARLYQDALVANQAKTDFLAVMSHELRTPLNAIMGYSELLRAEIPGPLTEKQREELGRIDLNARELLRMIDEVLTFSRMGLGTDKALPEPVDLSELVRETAEAVQPLALEKGLSFRVHAPEEPTMVETDPGKVRQILTNLLSNAVKFTEHGEIELRAGVEHGTIVLQVRDTGIGIAPEYREKIFDPFWQVEAATTRRVGGTGLGLSVARRLARMLGGDATVESVPGKGSTFTVALPARGEKNAARAADGGEWGGLWGASRWRVPKG